MHLISAKSLIEIPFILSYSIAGFALGYVFYDTNNIFTSMNNINLNCVLGTKKDGKYTSFLDNYDNK